METIKRRQTIWIASAIILMVIVALFFNNRLSEIDQKLSELQHFQHQIDNVSSSIHDISYEVDRQLNEFTQEQMWVQDKKLEILDIQNNTADIQIDWVLKDLNKGEKVSLLMRNLDEEDWEEFEVTSQSGLNYTFQNTLPVTNNYELQLLASSEDSQRTEKLLDLNLKEMLDSRVTIDAHIHDMGVDQRYDLFIFIHTNPDLVMNEYMTSPMSQSVEIKSAQAYILINGEVHEEIDLLKDHTNRVHGQHYEYSGEVTIEENARKVELSVIVEDELGWKYETIQDVY